MKETMISEFRHTTSMGIEEIETESEIQSKNINETHNSRKEKGARNLSVAPNI